LNEKMFYNYIDDESDITDVCSGVIEWSENTLSKMKANFCGKVRCLVRRSKLAYLFYFDLFQHVMNNEYEL